MAFRVQSELAMDGSRFFSVLNQARGAAAGFARSVGGRLAAAFSVGAITAFGKKIIDFAGHLRDLADATKLNVEWFQRFANTARKSGASEDDISAFVGRMQQSRQAAVNNPGGNEAQAFERLGISEADVSSLSPQKMMDKIIEAFGDGVTSDERNALQDIGGKAALRLVSAFQIGRAHV